MDCYFCKGKKDGLWWCKLSDLPCAGENCQDRFSSKQIMELFKGETEEDTYEKR